MNLSEMSAIVVTDIPVTMTASTPITSPYINSDGADQIECLLHLAASVVGATSVGKIEIMAASDAVGTGAVALAFKDLYATIGAPAIRQGTGKATRIEQMVGNVPTAINFYNTLAADGDKQQQYVVPIRARSLPAGKKYIAVRFTAGAAVARAGSVTFIKHAPHYGFDNRPAVSLFT